MSCKVPVQDDVSRLLIITVRLQGALDLTLYFLMDAVCP